MRRMKRNSQATELYERIRDLKAFELVQQHFDALAQVVCQNHGAVIRTIGDAVEAAFLTPLDAVDATLAMFSEIENFNTERGKHQIVRKAGVQRGHAIAVTLNEQLDYFVQIVNIASRVQNLGSADETHVTEKVYGQAGVSDALAGLLVEALAAQLKGISSTQHVYRVVSKAR